MASNLTTYLKNKLTDHVLRKTAFTAPSNVYVALHTQDPTVTGAVGEVTTGAFPGYARKALTLGTPANGLGNSTADLQWDNTPNIKITHVTIWDAVTAGNPLFFGPLTAEKQMGAGDVFRIPSGSLTAGFE